MGLLSDIWGGGKPAARGSQPGGLRRIEAILGQLGWPVDGRVGDSGLLLDFKDPAMAGGVRQVLVTAGGDGRIALLSAFSAAAYRPADLPPHLGDFLLLRNKEAQFVAWQLTDTDGKVGFAVSYTALVDGLDAGTFKLISETLVREASAVDGGLRQRGLL